MIEYKGVKYNFSFFFYLNGKGRMFMYSINFEPLKKINASTFQEARKKVEKIIDENLHQRQ